MSDRYLKHDVNEILVPVASATGFERGDLVKLSSGEAIEAAAETWVTDLATTQRNFVSTFLGVSQQRKVADVAQIFGNPETNTVMVSTTGEYEFDCASATFAVGDLVGPAKQSGNALENQKVVAVASEDLAIGRVSRAGTSVTKVQVRLLSREMPYSRNADGIATFASTTSVIASGLSVGATATERATIKAIYDSGTIAVTVPSITDPDIAKVDVDTSALTFAAAVGDAVIAIPLEALPTNCRLQGAFVVGTDSVQICFGSEGGNVTGAAKNFKLLFFDLT